MNEKILKVASKVTKPISLASILVIVFYFIYKTILNMGIFSILSEGNSFLLLDSIANKIFILATLGLVSGIVSFTFSQILKSKFDIASSSLFITGNVYFDSGHPVENATVFVEGLDRRKLTDPNGWFQIEVSKSKTWLVKAVYNEKIISKAVELKNINDPISLILPKDESPAQGSGHSQPIHNLPQPDYGRFVGREDEKKELIQLLFPYPRSAHSVITILGVGGMGKTSLALEIANRYLYDCDILPLEERFQVIIWFSAKETVLSGNQILPRWPAQKTIDDLYSTIAGVFNTPEIHNGLSLEEIDLKIRQILKNQRTLLILDNLETVDDNRLLYFILHPPVPTKIIVTTRHWVSVAFPLKLEGMPHLDALDMIDQQAKIGDILLDDNVKEKLIARTGGIPLAIVWCIGLVRSGIPINVVLDKLGNSESSVLQFIFKTSIDQIRESPALSLLVTLALFLEYASDYKVRQYANREELGVLSQLPNADRDEGLASLYQLSLINQSSTEFSLLPLTKTFVIEEIVENSKNRYDVLRKRIDNAVFELSGPTPFVYGTPVGFERFIGREKEIRTIVNRMLSSQSTIIIGEPRSGKSSLLNYIASSDIQKFSKGDLIESINIKINASDISTPAEFWNYILKTIKQNTEEIALKREIEKQIVKNTYSGFELETIFLALSARNKKVIVFLDEIEFFFSKPAFSKNTVFWGVMRSLASRAMSFQLLIASTYSLESLNRLTQEINLHGSPFFNFYSEVFLRPFEQKTVEKLISTALQSSQIDFSRNEVKLITWLSGNHPYRLQVAGSILFEVKTDTTIADDDKLLITMQQFFERTKSHFNDLWERYFDQETKISLLYFGLIDIINILEESSEEKAAFKRTSFSNRNARNLERMEWIQQFKNDTWRIISVGGYLLWLIDTLDVKNKNLNLENWVMSSILASELVKFDDWKKLFEKIGEIKGQNPVQTLSRSVSKRFS